MIRVPMVRGALLPKRFSSKLLVVTISIAREVMNVNLRARELRLRKGASL